MSLYTGVSLETLVADLAQAQTALPLLRRGEAIGSMSIGDKRIAFSETTPEALEKEIRDLQAAIAALTNGSLTRKGFYIGGGKGL